MFKVPEQYRQTTGSWGSNETYGNNGMFIIPKNDLITLRVIASDGMGWEHVSISIKDRTPIWDEMCWIKDLFWDDEDAVIQFHPPKSLYVNHHPYCLHLWRSTIFDIPLPDPIMLGSKTGSS